MRESVRWKVATYNESGRREEWRYTRKDLEIQEERR